MKNFLIETKNKILVISLLIFVVFTIIAILFSSNIGIASNIFVLGIISLVVPYSIYSYLELKKKEAFEKEFPVLMYDISESLQVNDEILSVIKNVSKGDYGPLTPHIKKMSAQISHNVPIKHVLETFMDSMKNSPVIVRATLVLIQAIDSGEDLKGVSESLVRNINLIREAEKDKKNILGQQILTMYAIYYVFIGIAIALISFLVPLISSGYFSSGLSIDPNTEFGSGSSLDSNPCGSCIQGGTAISCIGCSAFFVISDTVGFGDREEPKAYYTSVFFVMILMQGIFSGLIAGQIVSNSMSAGVKHSLIMLITGALGFILVINLGLV